MSRLIGLLWGSGLSIGLRSARQADAKRRSGRRTLERYSELLRCHVLPTMGERRLQQLQAAEIDRLYVDLGGKTVAADRAPCSQSY